MTRENATISKTEDCDLVDTGDNSDAPPSDEEDMSTTKTSSKKHRIKLKEDKKLVKR